MKKIIWIGLLLSFLFGTMSVYASEDEDMEYGPVRTASIVEVEYLG